MAREDRENQRPKTKASDIYSGSGVTKAVKGVQNAAPPRGAGGRTASTLGRPLNPSAPPATPQNALGTRGAFPNTRRSALDQATAIRQAEERAGPAGRAAAGIRSIGPLAAGFSQDVMDSTAPVRNAASGAIDQAARFLDELVTGSSENPLTLGDIFGGSEGNRTPGRTPAAAPASATGNARGTPVAGPNPSRGFIMSENGANTVALGDQARNPVNFFDNRAALDEFGAANRIRQQTVDAQPRGAGIVVPDQGPSAGEQADALLATINGRMSVAEQQGIEAQADALLGRESLGASMDETLAREAGATDRALLDAEVDSERNRGIVAAARARAQNDPITPQDFQTMMDSGVLKMDPETGRPDLTDPQTATMYTNLLESLAPTGFDQRVPMAEGGVVPRANSAMALPSLGRAGPALPMGEDIQAFQQLSEGMRQMGLPAVDFESFMSMRDQNAPVTAGKPPQGPQLAGPTSAIGLANGGMVPDASGKMVVDSDPNAQTDSIPAMIDGEQPAALDSGEFVIPKDVVMFFGTDKLNKMIAAARKTDGPESKDVGGSALQAALAAATGGATPGLS